MRAKFGLILPATMMEHKNNKIQIVCNRNCCELNSNNEKKCVKYETTRNALSSSVEKGFCS
jgi:hypothetical protein